jgi:hypothetical protein
LAAAIFLVQAAVLLTVAIVMGQRPAHMGRFPQIFAD